MKTSIYNYFLKSITNESLLVSNSFKDFVFNINGYELLNNLLNTGDLYYPDFKVSLNGDLVETSEFSDIFRTLSERELNFFNPEKLKSLLDNSAQLIVMNIEQKNEKIRTLIEMLEDQFKSSLEANIIFCTKNGQKFSTHFDDHHILILQLEGEKDWTLFERQDIEPIEDTDDESLPYRVKEDNLKIVLRETLVKGDIMFMPSFYPHKVVATGPSLHLNIAINSSLRNKRPPQIDVLRDLL